MLLRRVVSTSAEVAATSKRSVKRDLLAALLADVEGDEVEATVGLLIGEPRQGALGVGWATVARVAEAAGDPRHDPDSAPPTAVPSDAVPPTAEAADAAGVTVARLDQVLSELAATAGPGSNRTRQELLTGLWRTATEAERQFMARLLTGGLRQGALAGVVTDAVAAAAGVPAALMRRATMLQGDLPQAALVALTRGAEGLDTIDLEVGRPIQPMLATTAETVDEAVADLGLAQVEWKLDGARIQLHRRGDDVAVYTRNLNDVTDRLPQVCELARALPCSSVVLDGEIIGFLGDRHDADADADADAESGRARPPEAFQDTMSAFGRESAGSGAGLQPFFFDLMFLDGTSLIDAPLSERSGLLGELVGANRIPLVQTDDGGEARAQLEAALAAGHEGVMVKGVDSRYEAGRRGKTWRKVKPVHTLDLVVLAAEWGHGRRRGWLSNLHLGARDSASGELVMVGKTFKGLTDKLLAWQTEAFLARRLDETDESHTVVVRPELVVEIALDGAQRSTRYPGGVALRFARVRQYRPDRSPDDADTLDAVRALL